MEFKAARKLIDVEAKKILDRLTEAFCPEEIKEAEVYLVENKNLEGN